MVVAEDVVREGVGVEGTVVATAAMQVSMMFSRLIWYHFLS